MPESVLKRFENQHHQYYYYDVKQGFIGSHGHAGSTNTQLGFYSRETEELLNANVEKPFSDLFRIVDEISVDPPRGHIDSIFDYTAKRFVYALVARNPDNIDRIMEYPFFTDYLTPQQLRDAGMMLGLAAEAERDFLADYGTTVAVNTTDIPFILPTCGVYFMRMGNIEHIVLPLSPKKAIVFVEPNGKDTVIHEGIVHPYRIDNDRHIHMFNKGASSTQCRYGNGYVVSPDKAALEDALRESKH